VNCILASHSRITIGERTTIGPGVYIYDHDHDFRTEGGIVKDKYISEGVTIGKEVWIGAQTIILKGTVIGDNAVVGAGCVISEHIPSNTVYIQRRNSIIKHYDTDISRS
jgi:acetyltransferase-like isoleucine patch superfamily enzyme